MTNAIGKLPYWRHRSGEDTDLADQVGKANLYYALRLREHFMEFGGKLGKTDVAWRRIADCKDLGHWKRVLESLMTAGFLAKSSDGDLLMPRAVEEWKWRESYFAQKSENAKSRSQVKGAIRDNDTEAASSRLEGDCDAIAQSTRSVALPRDEKSEENHWMATAAAQLSLANKGNEKKTRTLSPPLLDSLPLENQNDRGGVERAAFCALGDQQTRNSYNDTFIYENSKGRSGGPRLVGDILTVPLERLEEHVAKQNRRT